MAENADAACDGTNLLAAVGEVRGIGNDNGCYMHTKKKYDMMPSVAIFLTGGLLAFGNNTGKGACVVKEHLLDGVVKHVGAAVDGRQTRKALRQLTESCNRKREKRVCASE